ncbi:Uncharacterised protein [Mycoplasmopsis californica]|uniref:Lipoprotein n=1 Tax=Mycoplasmopsis equigenitalium TaxID=114883 RepID=A0ABY5J142_9BACT|nr:hypothetical protein [Mycoplasmopsis equigenitalium]UUD36976.1 hypothetical protein NPA09_00120 [Mycoplasmopsis equigenitalium]VEU69728.1 Uncharacterised protein [Mycoplasmopsis californica]
MSFFNRKLFIFSSFLIPVLSISCANNSSAQWGYKNWDWNEIKIAQADKNIDSSTVEVYNSQTYSDKFVKNVIIPEFKNAKNSIEFVEIFKKYFRIRLTTFRPHIGVDQPGYHVHWVRTEDVFEHQAELGSFQMQASMINNNKFYKADFRTNGEIFLEIKIKMASRAIDASKDEPLFYLNKNLRWQVC